MSRELGPIPEGAAYAEFAAALRQYAVRAGLARGTGTEVSKRLELLGQAWRPETVRRWLNGRSIPPSDTVELLSEVLAKGTRTSAADVRLSLHTAMSGYSQASGQALPSSPASFFPLPGYFVPRPELEASVWTALLAPTPAGTARMAAITGMAGVGKSTLARAVCSGPRAGLEFPDGVLWVDVGPEATASITACQARILEYCGRSGVILDRPSGLHAIRTALAGQRMLIVLDDVWSAEQIRSLLPHDPATALLITSRNEHAILFGTSRVQVEPFDPGPDADVVLACMEAQPGSARVPALSRITSVCAGLPLALAIAGSLVREAATFWGLSAEGAWEDVAERLEHAGIDALEARFRDYPYDSLAAALDVSVTSLPRPDQVRFAELAVVNGYGWIPVATVRRLWRDELKGLPECRTVLARLARRALLDYDHVSDRIRVHDLVQEYLSKVCEQRSAGDLHLQIARSYLDDWGGAAAGLPLLAESAGNADAAYGINRLIHHLVASGALELASDVLMSQSENGENAWLTVRERSGQVEPYLEDLSQVGIAAGIRSDASIAAGRPAGCLVVELTCAALRASVTGRAASLPGPVPAALVRRGVWSLDRVLGYARGTPEPEPRAVMLSCLLPETAEPDRPALALEALRATRLIGSPGTALKTLAGLAPWLMSTLDDEISWILASEHPSRWPQLRQVFTAVLAAHLTPSFIADQIDLAEAGPGSQRHQDMEPSTAGFIVAVAPFAPLASRGSLLRRARALTITYQRLRALAAMHDVLPAGQKRRVVNDLTETAFRGMGETVHLDLVLSRLAGGQRDTFVLELLDGSRTLGPYRRLSCLSQLGKYLHGEVAEEVTDVFRSWAEPHWSAAVPLMEYLDEPQRRLVLNEVLDEQPPWSLAEHTENLVALAPYSAADLLGRAAEAINGEWDLSRRCHALAQIAGRLPAAHLADTCRQLLEDPSGAQDSYACIQMLHRLAPVLPDDLVATALDTLARCEYSSEAGEVLAQLSPRMTAGQLESTLGWLRPADDDVAFARAISQLAAPLPAAEASAVARRILDLAGNAKKGSRGQIVTHALPLLPADDLPGTLPVLAEEHPQVQSQIVIKIAGRLRAHDIARSIIFARSIQDAQERAYALAALARQVPGPDSVQLYREALRDAAVPSYSTYYDTDDGEGYERSDADSRCLADIARQVPDVLMPHIVDLAIAGSGRPGMIAATWDRLNPQQQATWRRSVQTSNRRFELSVALLPHLAEPDRVDLASELLDELRPPPGHHDYARAAQRSSRLRALFQVIPPSLIPDTRQLAGEVLSTGEQLRYLPGLTGEQEVTLAESALEAISQDRWSNSNAKSWSIYYLARNLPSAVMPQALQILCELDDGYDRRQALEALAPHLPAELIAPARDLALSLSNPSDRIEALTALAPMMPDADRRTALTVILDEQNVDARSKALGELAQFLPQDRLPAALDALYQTTGAIHQPTTIARFGKSFADPASRNHQTHWNESWRTLLRVGATDRESFFSLLADAAKAVEHSTDGLVMLRLIGTLEDIRRWLP
jgi:hypothetical protein